MPGQSFEPIFLYGTAWKEEKTADLTLQALRAGFRALDTANQRKHYFEEAVGQGVQTFLKESGMSRQELFLQTKYTFARGQDHRKPYNESDPFSKQVQDSLTSSLKHLQSDYLDSYILHGPYRGQGIGNEDLEAWGAMEELYHAGLTRALGVSNVSADQLNNLCAKAKVKPKFVQNRCFAKLGWDFHVRQVCREQGLRYQGFSLLTANVQELTNSPAVLEAATKYKKSIPQIVFRFSHQLGMLCLTGTSNPQHMAEDLLIESFELTQDEVALIEEIAL